MAGFIGCDPTVASMIVLYKTAIQGDFKHFSHSFSFCWQTRFPSSVIIHINFIFNDKAEVSFWFKNFLLSGEVDPDSLTELEPQKMAKIVIVLTDSLLT